MDDARRVCASIVRCVALIAELLMKGTGAEVGAATLF
jgi:hypothetical protein